MDDVLAFQNAIYSGEIRDHDPAGTWRVDVSQTTGYLQANFRHCDCSFGGNVRCEVCQDRPEYRSTQCEPVRSPTTSIP